MILKRMYDTSGHQPVLDHIKVLKHSKIQKFTPKMVNQSLVDGLMEISDGKITLNTVPRLVYRIEAVPGIYCCFDGKKMPDQKIARQYVADNFSGQQSPDSENPSGYRQDNFFLCELIEEGANNG